MDLNASNSEVSDVTQRLSVNAAGTPQHRRSAPNQRTNSEQRRRATAEKKKKEKILVITLCSISAVLLIAAIIGICSILLPKSPTDGLIQPKVFAAGIDLGGMTPEQAKVALHQATDNTFSKLDMTITVLDTQILLSPKDTGATLNVDAVVDAAYNYGRNNNQAQGASYTVNILPYLSLDTEYIQSKIRDLGAQYSTTLKQSEHTVQGTKPNLPIEEINPSTVHQTLTITIGTAEYSLNIDKLYQQVLDAYNINLFEVVGTCAEVAPDPLDVDALFDLYCTEAVNAEINTETLEITPEQYGYGVTKEALRTAIENAAYGDTITLELRYIKPDITADFYSKEMFQDTLASHSTTSNAGDAWLTNMKLVCDALNGTIVKSGEEFSINQLVGEPALRDGYLPVNIYVGKTYREVIGAGISQVASTLYNCVLIADLEVLERHSHSYTPGFIDAGFDAEVYFGQLDFRFRNTTEQPIRIDATLIGNTVTITLIGTDTRDYTVEIAYKVDKTKTPAIVYNTMTEDNPGKYKDGDILVQPITGYDISTYIRKYSKDTGALISENVVTTSAYSKLDQVVVKIETPPTEPPTENPTGDATELPSETPTEDFTEAPTKPTKPTKVPTEPTKPTEAPTRPTKPTKAPTEPTKPTEAPTRPTKPTKAPTEPTKPTEAPTKPTKAPTEPIKPTEAPTKPTKAPTEPTEPTEAPTRPTKPTEAPTRPTKPTKAPTEPTKPTEAPTEKPTEAPTEEPTEAPTEEPTEAPTEEPTEAPTEEPTEAPTEEPTEAPTEEPTEAPTEEPTEAPTEEPTEVPTEEPTEAPTEAPTEEPAEAPTEATTELLNEEATELTEVPSESMGEIE